MDPIQFARAVDEGRFVVGKCYVCRSPWYARLWSWLRRRRQRLVVTEVDEKGGVITVEAQL